MSLRDRLAALRADPDARRRLTVAGVVVGVALGWLHWLGFVVGGALTALPQRSVRGGLVAGVGFGAIAWLGFAAWLALQGALGTYLGMGQVFGVSLAVPLVLGLLGGLIRGVV